MNVPFITSAERRKRTNRRQLRIVTIYPHCVFGLRPVGEVKFLLVPRGVAHSFGNAGDVEARLLVIHATAMDAYFGGLHELWNAEEPPTADDERALMARFGMESD